MSSQKPAPLNVPSPHSRGRSWRFISLRWRFLVPVALAVLLTSMAGAYIVASNLTGELAGVEQNILVSSSAAIDEQVQARFDTLVQEARRIAFTVGVAPAIAAGAPDTAPLEQYETLEALAVAGDLDSAILVDAQGQEVAGVLRVGQADAVQYSLSTGTDLTGQAVVQASLIGVSQPVAGIWRTPRGLHLVAAVPVVVNDVFIGTVVVGRELSRFIAEVPVSTLVRIALFDGDGALLQLAAATPPPVNQLDPLLRDQILFEGQRVLDSLEQDGQSYRVAYAPLRISGQTLAISAVTLPDQVPYASFAGRQATALMAALITGAVIVAAYAGLSLLAARADRVTATAQALTRGHAVRTNLRPHDEIGVMGRALDQYADAVAVREDNFRDMLRRQRRELYYLIRVLESIPDGIVVQDMEGQVVLINDMARAYLGVADIPASLPWGDPSRILHEMMGETIAPGIYTLGDPRTLQHAGRMLRAQAAAVMSPAQVRLGSVILLRDITEDVQDQQVREALLSQLSSDIEQPLAHLAQRHTATHSPLVDDFAREIARHTAILQKMIVDMRELTQYSRRTARQVQRPLAVETLVWALANEWRQIAHAAGLSLEVNIGPRDLYVLGDEGRLRYALGNLVDNAIKYTPSGGRIAIDIKDAVQGAAHLRVRDNGVGISDEDVAHIFMSFYRGQPVSADGSVIHVPGMGLGLPQARQIISAHGGLLRVRTRLHVGTAAYIALPLTSGLSYAVPPVRAADLEGETVALTDIDLDALWRA